MDAKSGEKLDFFSSIDNVYVVYAIDKKKLLNHPLFKSKKWFSMLTHSMTAKLAA